MVLVPADTPLYNHPLPEIEAWLTQLGCQQDPKELHCWNLEKPTWKARICLDIEELTVSYLDAGERGQNLQRSFKYSLSRKDVEAAVFSGP